jgi:hypothetical protein
LTLARADHYLKSPKHSREIMPEFKNDWALLEAARVNSTISTTANNGASPSGSHATVVSFSQIQ